MSTQGQDAAPRDEARPVSPAYFAIVTGPVLDDRILSDSAKLLYGRITSLTDREGYCWATNKTLSDLTGYGERTISRLVAQLEERGHIWTESVPALRKGGHERRIYIGARAAKKVASNGEAKGEKRVDKIGEGSQFWRGGVDKNGEAYLMRNNKQDNIPPIVPQAGDSASACRRVARPHKTKYTPDWKPERFAGFWDFYPRHEKALAAVTAWDALRPSDELIATIGRALEVLKATDEWQRGIGVPYAATFLNGERWRDAEGVRSGKAQPSRRLEPPADDGEGGWTWVE